jgi:hypothetical protein
MLGQIPFDRSVPVGFDPGSAQAIAAPAIGF